MHMEEAANLISSLQQTLSEVDSVMAKVNERSTRTVLHIEAAAQRLLQTITEHRHKLIAKVGEITEAKLRALQAEKDNVQHHFKDVENALRYAPNRAFVEDAKEWETAIAQQLAILKEQTFDFQEYDEDLRFHFLYRDEDLLSAICNFGDVVISNSSDPSQAYGKDDADKQQCSDESDHAVDDEDDGKENASVCARENVSEKERVNERFAKASLKPSMTSLRSECNDVIDEPHAIVNRGKGGNGNKE